MYCFALSSRFALTSLQLGPLEIIHFLLKAWNIKPNFHEVLCYSFLFCLNQTNNLRLDFMIRFHYLPEVTFNKERRFWSEFLMFRVKTQDGSMETFFYVALTGLKPKVKTTFFDAVFVRCVLARKPFFERQDASKRRDQTQFEH